VMPMPNKQYTTRVSTNNTALWYLESTPTKPNYISISAPFTINTQYKTSICEAITAPTLRQHVCATNKWSKATMRLVNDDAL
jgi:hypothetical protein